MGVRHNVEMLRAVDIFAGLADAHLQVLAFAGERSEVAAGRWVYRQGDQTNCGYLLLDGRAVLIDGEKATARLAPGAFFGELAMVAQIPHRYGVRAEETLVVDRFTHDLFMRVISEFPEAGVAVMKQLQAKLDRSVDDLARVKDMFEAVGGE